MKLATIIALAFVATTAPLGRALTPRCRHSPVTNSTRARDAEIKKLCGEIISSQQREIDQMKSMLARLI
jgi:Domain of unknown function (DUF305)